MPKFSNVLYYAIHVQELRSIIQWKLWHDPVHERNEAKETPTMRTCFALLEKTSRSFAMVIQELHPELLFAVALFYLILRGLDTVEDDMTIALDEKDPLLRDFHKVLRKPGWNYNGNGPNEKDRDVLVKFDVIIEEFLKIKPQYRETIEDITNKMGNGMADYARNAEHNINGVNSIKDYDLYCHYVAGLVGEGLTRLFVDSGLANEALLERPHLQESMGLFLQKTNIIRDIREDFDDKRRFWPKEIWSRHVEKFEDLFDEKNLDKALNCSSDMVLNALEHADECLFYLAGLREQSVFNFAAIPQAMAIATLHLVFRNPDIFKKNIKITKGEACQNMLESTQNLKTICDLFRRYTRKIHQKNVPKDPNFLKISMACGKIEQFVEAIFPSQDPKAVVRQSSGGLVEPTEEAKKQAQADAEARKDVFWLFVAVFATLFFVSAVMIAIAWFMGARFDLAFDQAKQHLPFGLSSKPSPIASKIPHGEL
ncbi:farnesyl-diphosphate farnesyltransferase [Xylona heveae TC161]|uniref:Squalene synthase n=1 Tax=Xylona heveae (strain CBS 132557 / TC161) TaxID=1328760 RepID=A0A165I0S1_XYLHT|nr:farnesyl-diphosphate farnesyltransferase [Xylona heveae TC161]KZF24198.1 farnesyl-diphosphate farnesyltransferase [Xylona heveae TC161]